MAFHEMVAAGEAARFEQFAAELAELQRLRAEGAAVVSRALHLKQHVGVVGELRVNAAEGARVGAFSGQEQSWPLYARFSNGSSRRQVDKLPDVRGFALKLVGVPGRKVIPGLEQEQTQDFLFIDTPLIPFRDPEEFMTFVRAAKDGPAKLLPRLIANFGVGRSFSLIKRLLKSPKVASYATHAFHTAAPIAFGDTAAKLALFPATNAASTAAAGDDALGVDLSQRLATGPLSWALRAQRFVDEQSTPIEDTSITWQAPWVELGTLTLPKQDVHSPRGNEINDLVARLSFDPWHALEAHRPLGAIMRARAVAYRVSSQARQAAPEPKTVLEVS